MAKIQLSNAEFNLLCQGFNAEQKAGHILWRNLVDAIDEVFTVKGLEKNSTLVPTGARTQANYGRPGAEKTEKQLVQEITNAFRELLVRQRLDAKSFFQDWDRHKHFKVTAK